MSPTSSLELLDRERSWLRGEAGEAMALAMRLIVAAAEVSGATALVPISMAHLNSTHRHRRTHAHQLRQVGLLRTRAARRAGRLVTHADINLAAGALTAEALYGARCPVLLVSVEQFESLQNGEAVHAAPEGNR